MTSEKAIKKAIETVEFDKNLAISINDKEYLEGYSEVKKKLEEALELMKKYNLI